LQRTGQGYPEKSNKVKDDIEHIQYYIKQISNKCLYGYDTNKRKFAFMATTTLIIQRQLKIVCLYGYDNIDSVFPPIARRSSEGEKRRRDRAIDTLESMEERKSAP
jgi:hypothetical protein